MGVAVCTSNGNTAAWRFTALLRLVIPLVVPALLSSGLVSGVGSAALGLSVRGLGVGSVRSSLRGRTARGLGDGWVSTRSVTVVARAI